MAHSGDFSIDLKVSNYAGLIARLEQGGKAARAEILKAVGESASRMYQRTYDLAPKKTFFMVEHLRTDFSKGGFTFETGWVATDFLGTTDEKGNSRAFYPPFVELGTRHMRAQPSLSIAFREEEPRFKAAISRALDKAYRSGTRSA